MTMPVTIAEMTLYSTQEACKLTGRKVPTITRIARVHKLGRRIGTGWFFTPEEVEKIKGIDPRGGRPPQDGRPVTHGEADTGARRGRPPRQP